VHVHDRYLGGPGGPNHPISGLIEHRSRWPATSFVQRFQEFPGKARLFVGAQKAGNRQFFAARDNKQPIDSEVLDLNLVERDPEGIEHPFPRATEVTDLANPELRRSHRHLLVRFGMAVVETERPIQQEHIQAEEAEHRPRPEQKKQNAGDETDASEQEHQNEKSDAAERAMRCQRRGKDRGFEIVGVVGAHCAQYTEIMAKKPARKSTMKLPKRAKRNRAKVKSAPKRAAADAKDASGEIPQWTPAQIEEAFRRFKAANPEPKGELQHINPFTLLVAVVLSAQATDAGVNKATPVLFALADTPEKMAALGEGRVRDLIKTIGLFRTKAKNVIGLSQKLIAEHGGQVPRSREALEELPGVGRKTANVVLNMTFGQPTMAVDTHVFRIGNRTGLAPGKDPLAVELKLLEVIPEKYMMHAHHWLILHGRYVCLALRPLCEKCVIADLCKWPGKTVAV